MGTQTTFRTTILLPFSFFCIILLTPRYSTHAICTIRIFEIFNKYICVNFFSLSEIL